MSALLSLILCLATSQSAAPQRQSDRAVDGFVGPVKKVTQVWTPVSGGNYPKGSKCRQLLDEYDETGRIMRHSVYPGTCGEDEIREDYKYARDGSRTALVQEIRGPAAGRPWSRRFAGRIVPCHLHHLHPRIPEERKDRSGRCSSTTVPGDSWKKAPFSLMEVSLSRPALLTTRKAV